MEYSKEQLEMIRATFVMQFGEEDGEKVFQLQKRVLELSAGSMDEENMKKLQEATDEYTKFCQELNEKAAEQSKHEIYDGDEVDEDNEEENEEENAPLHSGLIDKDSSDYDSTYDSDDDEEDEDEIYDDKTEYEKMLLMYTDIFGAENGTKLADYMIRISEINNDEGVNDSNVTELEELMEKYQTLLDSLGGQKRIVEYSMNYYNEQKEQINTRNEYDEDDEDDEDDEYDEYDEDDEDDEDGETIGVDAIDEAVEDLYGKQEGFCFGTVVPFYLGGNDPLDMVRIFESESGGIPHWHYITYGLSELYGKESDDKEVSGFGFELTFRLKKNEDQPPKWPVSLLQNIARYVFKTGNVFAPGHHMDANGPIQLGYDTDITALAFIEEPELPNLETENGSVEFIQMIGITNDEMEAVMCWDCRKLMRVFDEFIPYGVTDLDRKTFMTDQKVHNALMKGIEKDGSSTGYIYTDFLMVSVCENRVRDFYGSVVDQSDIAQNDKRAEVTTVYLGAGQIERVALMLKGRLLKKRSFMLEGEDVTVFFELGDEFKVEADKEECEVTLTLTESIVNEISEKVKPKVGEYLLSSGEVNFKIIKTEIKDNNGNIVETIG